MRMEGNVLCTDCGRENPEYFRFCGMCGKPLAQPETLDPAANERKSPSVAEAQGLRNSPVATSIAPPFVSRADDVPSDSELLARSGMDPELYPVREEQHPRSPDFISGPSILGLASPEPNTEYTYLLEDETSRRPGRAFVGIVLLLAVIGVGWWQVSKHGGPAVVAAAFKNKLQGRAPEDGINRSKAALEQSANNPNARESEFQVQNGTLTPAPANGGDTTNSAGEATQRTEPPSASGASAAKPNAEEAVRTEEKSNTTRPPESQPEPTGTEAAVKKPAEEGGTANSTPESGSEQANNSHRSRGITTELASKRDLERVGTREPATAPANTDDGTARLAEKYLYGQGVPQDCNRAVELLRPAAEASNVKARTMLGTMYATGHCVARDLPTSYRWFALAMRQQPRNPWVTKDLEMVWNQMDPSQKQLAMKMAK
ncbi:MAG TPA: hypothetical protein VFA90_13420 [Terriglobales bacterium]|nr:hypothetical protein [Terriglobales bacterium]